MTTFLKVTTGLLALVQRPRDAKNWRGPYVKEIPKTSGATIICTNSPAGTIAIPLTSHQRDRTGFSERKTIFSIGRRENSEEAGGRYSSLFIQTELRKKFRFE